MSRRLILGLVLPIIVGAIVILQYRKVAPDQSTLKEKNNASSSVPEITKPAGFINAEPFQLADLIGKKVVMVDFWTYSCINCQRTLPYLNDWYQKYKDNGLEIIGVHTPEFEFEKVMNNVQTAVKKFSIQYPVVLDNDYGTWEAYQNHYWPHKFLIDIKGNIVYDHVGEGGYQETEQKIQALLKERMQVLGERGALETNISNPKNAIVVVSGGVQSPEVYFGASRNEFFAGQQGTVGEGSAVVPTDSKLNRLYLTGVWYIAPEYASTKTPGAKIVFRYHAKDVYLVAGSVSGAVVKVARDGKALGVMAGEDVDTNGKAQIQENRLYKLVQDSAYGEHVIEIELISGELEAFTFTFG